MSHRPVMFTVSYDNVVLLGAAAGQWDDGDFAYSADTATFYMYTSTAPFPPGSVPSVEGGAWAPFGSLPIHVTTAYVEDLYTCTPATNLLDAVYVQAPGVVDQADATTLGSGAAVGVVTNKPTPTTAYVRYQGKLAGFAGLVPGRIYYLGATPGAIVDTPVDAPGNVVQRIGVAETDTTLILGVTPNTVVM